MKKILSIAICFLLFIICLPVFIEAESQDSIQSGNYRYIVLEDGTAAIIWYRGKEKSLTIPEKIDGITVTHIGQAFWWNYDVTSITIPDSITISDKINPFNKCEKLKQVIVSPNHPTLATIDGVLFSKIDKCLLWYPITATEKEYTIPDGIMCIADYAFLECDTLSSVIIPDSVTSIGKEAFYDCDRLSSVTFHDSKVSIVDNPFLLSNNLSKIIVSQDHPTLKVINGALFSKPDKRLVCMPSKYEIDRYEIPEGTEIIGHYAFSYCNHLTSISIPKGVTTIMDCAFLRCNSLSSITIPDTVNYIDYQAFRYCDNLKSVIVDPGSYAEEYCIKNKMSYTYPNSNDWLNN